MLQKKYVMCGQTTDPFCKEIPNYSWLVNLFFPHNNRTFKLYQYMYFKNNSILKPAATLATVKCQVVYCRFLFLTCCIRRSFQKKVKQFGMISSKSIVNICLVETGDFFYLFHISTFKNEDLLCCIS